MIQTKTRSGIDCDAHIVVPDNKALLPYLDDYWRDQIISRGLDAFHLATYPMKNPLAGRSDWRLPDGNTGTCLERLRSDVLETFGLELAICNVVYGGQVLFNSNFGVAVCRAVNDWVRQEWLDLEPRLRASIVIPMQDPDQAAAEVERCAEDSRFVQVLMLATGAAPFGQRRYWPIYRAAEKHQLPVAIHAGHSHHFAPSYVGWPSFHIEDYALQSQAIQGQLLSLVYEGVFVKFPALRVVMVESGVSWLPSFLWRADHTWRALRPEVPWLDRAPSEFVRDHVRLTAQPFDAPTSQEDLEALVEQLDAGRMLLFATDYPHWQFEGDSPLPDSISDDLAQRMMRDTPLETYPRLSEVMQ